MCLENQSPAPAALMFNSSASMVVVTISAHLPTGHSPFHGPVPLLVTETSLWQVLTPGTVCWLIVQSDDSLWTIR